MLVLPYRTLRNLALAGLIAFFATNAAADEQGLKQLTDLLFSASPGPSAATLKFSTNKLPKHKAQGDAFQEGDQIVLQVKVDKDAYLMVIGTTPDNELVIGFPVHEQAPGFLQGGKPYDLFMAGDFWLSLAKAKKPETGNLVFLLTSQPFRMAPMESTKREEWITISPSGDEQIKTLRDKLAGVEKDPGFNRFVLTLKDKAGHPLPLGQRLNIKDKAGPPVSEPSSMPDKAERPSLKKLPVQGSDGVETVSGSQGNK
jgi:hypothetical protein